MKAERNRKLPKSKGIYYCNERLSSEAYWKLTGTEIRVLNIFYLKRQLIDKKTAQRCRIHPDSADMVRNNGEIVFPYTEALKYGISNATYTRSIDKLIDVGFIDMSEQGIGHIPSKFSISDRWMNYGTPKFKKKTRPKLVNQNYGKNTRFKKNDNIY